MLINDSEFRGYLSNSFGRVKLKKLVKQKIACSVATNPKIKKSFVLEIMLLISPKKAVDCVFTVSSF